jgi:membrane-bound lytic murein transglycosylase B
METSRLDVCKKVAWFFALAALPGYGTWAAPPAVWPDPAEIPRFIEEISEKHGLDDKALAALFAPLKPNPGVLRAIAPPTDPGVKSWQRYRTRFLDQARIENGVRFWKANAETLARAEQAYGVPPAIIVAIIGVETEYGRNKGNFSVLDALSTIAFAYPPRREFFRSELEQFLLLARENRLAAEAVRGSYAGALGIPQFMPGSQRRYAVDFDQDGRIDLMNSLPDAIGSVARFLLMHGWQPGQAIAQPVAPGIPDPDRYLAAGIRPSFDAEKLRLAGLAEADLPTQSPAALIDLVSPGFPTEYWWGFENFYAITRYNRSSFYAMSVAQLSAAIEARRSDGQPLRNGAGKPAKSGSRAKYRRAE